ncbi:MAG TPA: SUMF1/EgtB/PvdO family nonheme iron enzyme [Candidatus Saccharimonadales bacterium]|jgi:formylglycine-generating enzyme required for sulfatase activity|nr:SUMF1/EgtB/PvdO family nonheme iron enzyme [Candidatus Saccharimonadales bacterium]
MPAAKPEPRYDVFISYRRGAADELALLLQTRLQQQGILAFLDRDLGRGTFDDKLLRRIVESPTFLIILTPNALDRCADEDDWMRKEIVQAIGSGRNIIPLKVDPFQFTPAVVKSLEPAVRELSRYQAVEYSRAYFEHTVDRIVKMMEEDKAERRMAREAVAAARQAEHRKPEAGVSNSAAKERNGQPYSLRKLPSAGRMMVGLALASLVAIGLWLGKPSSGKGPITQPPPQGTRTIDSKPTAEPQPRAPGTKTVNSKDGQTYVWIPPGTFQMGCSAGDHACERDEKPSHPVTITKGFWLGETPVTQAAYQRVMLDKPSQFQGEQLPAESVEWSLAIAYCEAAEMRLPTEAEWEYAARAGSDAPRYGNLKEIAWYAGNSNGKTHEVRQKQANRWGLYDMFGNVWEWVGDWYDAGYYKKSPAVNPTGPASGKYRVVRGGSWIDGSEVLRSSFRYSFVPDYGVGVGFRCVWEVGM